VSPRRASHPVGRRGATKPLSPPCSECFSERGTGRSRDYAFIGAGGRAWRKPWPRRFPAPGEHKERREGRGVRGSRRAGARGRHRGLWEGGSGRFIELALSGPRFGADAAACGARGCHAGVVGSTSPRHGGACTPCWGRARSHGFPWAAEI